MNAPQTDRYLLSKSTFIYGCQLTGRIWMNNKQSETDASYTVKNTFITFLTKLNYLQQEIGYGIL